MEFRDGYALTTKQVLTTRAYWEFILSNASSYQAPETLTDGIKLLANQSTGWLACESCSKMFTFDRHIAKDCAVRQANPPGSGAIDVYLAAGVAMPVFLTRKESPDTPTPAATNTRYEHNIGPTGICTICGSSSAAIQNFGWGCKNPEDEAKRQERIRAAKEAVTATAKRLVMASPLSPKARELALKCLTSPNFKNNETEYDKAEIILGLAEDLAHRPAAEAIKAVQDMPNIGKSSAGKVFIEALKSTVDTAPPRSSTSGGMFATKKWWQFWK